MNIKRVILESQGTPVIPKRVEPVDWLASVNAVTSESSKLDDFLDLAASESLVQIMISRLRAGKDQKCVVGIDQAAFVYSILYALSDGCKDLQVAWLHCHTSSFGALLFHAKIAFRDAMQLWELNGQDFQIITTDAENGFCLERNYYGKHGEYCPLGTYEIVSWGIKFDFNWFVSSD